MCHGVNMTGPMCSFLADFEQDDSPLLLRRQAAGRDATLIMEGVMTVPIWLIVALSILAAPTVMVLMGIVLIRSLAWIGRTLSNVADGNRKALNASRGYNPRPEPKAPPQSRKRRTNSFGPQGPILPNYRRPH